MKEQPTLSLHKDLETIEFLIASNTTKSKSIYMATLVSLVIIIASLPFIKVNISIQGAGAIRPISEKTEIKSSVSEVIESIYVKENEVVQSGSPILKLRTATIDSKLSFLAFQKQEAEAMVYDLKTLTTSSNPVGLKTVAYTQEFNYFHQQSCELQNKLSKAQKELGRNQKLYNNAVISEKEFDDCQYSYNTAKNEYQILIDNQQSKWQTSLKQQLISLKEINAQILQAEKEKELYTINAPVTGTVEQFSGYYPGNSLTAGQVVAVISPGSSLQAEIYISPHDIGYIGNNSKVVIQVDAFNYNEWGMLNGEITQISSDFIMANNAPMFRVRCSLDKSYLMLKNGFKGNLRKGMTVRARILVAKRSLFQLLYQKADKWLNPSQF